MSNLPKYQPAYVSQELGRTTETLRQWSAEFKEYLSSYANPESGHRRFTASDIQVLKLIKEMRAKGMDYDSIHASFKLEPPDESDADPIKISDLIEFDQHRKLEILQRSLIELQERYETLQEKERTTQSQNDQLLGENRSLKTQIEELRKELRRAYIDIGRLEVRSDADPKDET